MSTIRTIPPEKTEAILLQVLKAVTEGDTAEQTRAIFRAYVHLQDKLGKAAIEPSTLLDCDA